DRQRQLQQEIKRREIDQARGRRIDEQQLVFEERQQREIEDNTDRKPDFPVSQCQDQEQISSEDRDGQHCQQLRLAISVKEQAGEYQQLNLKGPQSRLIIGRKYGRGEDAELPGSEGHATPTVVGEALASQPGTSYPKTDRTAQQPAARFRTSEGEF